MAVVGMRRSGKTTFLWQCLADRLAAGVPREALVYVNFEDERLVGMPVLDLQRVVEEYFSLHPERRTYQPVTFFLDEIQHVSGWETFVRRLLDTERVEVFLSGSLRWQAAIAWLPGDPVSGSAEGGPPEGVIPGKRDSRRRKSRSSAKPRDWQR
jgi:hypothetical protein